jgi:hypothetical protein
MLDEWSEWRIGDEPPIKMPRVAEKLQLVAMKAIAAVREQMDDGNRRANADQNGEVGSVIC